MGRNNCYKKEVAECIKRKAYELWQKDGRKKGCDLHYWLQAEKIVKEQMKEQQLIVNVWAKRGGQSYLQIPQKDR